MDIAKENNSESHGGRFGRVMRVIGTIFLICVVTAMLFLCIFAFYVKTCITPGLDLDLNDFTLNQSSTIYYQDQSGQWQELSTFYDS